MRTQTPAVRMAGRVAAVAVLTALAAPALAQLKAGSETGLGLTGAEVPQLLQDVKADPYKAPVAPACDRSAAIDGKRPAITKLSVPIAKAARASQNTLIG